jgi:hypothetical protein
MHLNTKVSSLIPRNRKREGDVGIEIEAEFGKARDIAQGFKYWELHDEGSLRNGIEFVTRGATPIKGLDDVLNELGDFLKNNKIKFIDSKRASVHVHLNVQNFTLLHLYNALCCYWLVEPLLIDYCGAHRKGNLFCLTLPNADAIHSQVCQGLKNFRFFEGFKQRDMYRYSSINLEALYKFGTVEIRTMRCTQDTELIKDWTKNLHRLVHAAKEFNSPTHIADVASKSISEIFLQKFFTKSFIQDLRSTYRGDFNMAIHENLMYVMDLANSRDHWDPKKDKDEAGKRLEKPVPDYGRGDPFHRNLVDELQQAQQAELNNPNIIWGQGPADPLGLNNPPPPPDDDELLRFNEGPDVLHPWPEDAIIPDAEGDL